MPQRLSAFQPAKWVDFSFFSFCCISATAKTRKLTFRPSPGCFSLDFRTLQPLSQSVETPSSACTHTLRPADAGGPLAVFDALTHFKIIFPNLIAQCFYLKFIISMWIKVCVMHVLNIKLLIVFSIHKNCFFQNLSQTFLCPYEQIFLLSTISTFSSKLLIFVVLHIWVFTAAFTPLNYDYWNSRLF